MRQGRRWSENSNARKLHAGNAYCALMAGVEENTACHDASWDSSHLKSIDGSELQYPQLNSSSGPRGIRRAIWGRRDQTASADRGKRRSTHDFSDSYNVSVPEKMARFTSDRSRSSMLHPQSQACGPTTPLFMLPGGHQQNGTRGGSAYCDSGVLPGIFALADYRGIPLERSEPSSDPEAIRSGC